HLLLLGIVEGRQSLRHASVPPPFTQRRLRQEQAPAPTVLRGMKLVEMVEMKKTPLGTEFFCCFTFVWEESLFFWYFVDD
ncbi:MAG: hypothetical protein IKC47_02710, partial [Clostridia bacterium]|nr:hypothetical protein [Clostridia bacterium]